MSLLQLAAIAVKLFKQLLLVWFAELTGQKTMKNLRKRVQVFFQLVQLNKDHTRPLYELKVLHFFSN